MGFSKGHYVKVGEKDWIERLSGEQLLIGCRLFWGSLKYGFFL